MYPTITGYFTLDMSQEGKLIILLLLDTYKRFSWRISHFRLFSDITRCFDQNILNFVSMSIYESYRNFNKYCTYEN